MSTREGKDTIYFLEKRKEKSRKVKIQFVNPQDFNVLDSDGKIKYFGTVDLENNINDMCSCPSFQYGMKYDDIDKSGKKGKSLYLEYYGTAFQCKHIIRGKTIRKLGLYGEDQ